MAKPIVLITSKLISDRLRTGITPLTGLAELFHSADLSEAELNDLLPKVNVMIILEWPRFLRSRGDMRKMASLDLIQSALAGVEHIPYGIIPDDVIVCSNAGGFTEAVAEHAWALILTAGKQTNLQYDLLRKGEVPAGHQLELAKHMKFLNGAIFGVIGLGNIGRYAANIARAFGMKIYAITRSGTAHSPCDFVGRPEELHKVLAESDVVLLSTPLTKQTRYMIGKEELQIMKEDAVLVNIARGELVEPKALYEHLNSHPKFRYAADVWWTSPDGREVWPQNHPLFRLSNFLCTPHTSGALSFVKSRAISHAISNVARYIKGEEPENVVRREDYL